MQENTVGITEEPAPYSGAGSAPQRLNITQYYRFGRYLPVTQGSTPATMNDATPPGPNQDKQG